MKTFQQYIENLPGYDAWKLASPYDDDTNCPACRGEGEVDGEECQLCKGAGEVDARTARQYYDDMRYAD
jgi:hypothetical protein